jgi:hypothetical protein
VFRYTVLVYSCVYKYNLKYIIHVHVQVLPAISVTLRRYSSPTLYSYKLPYSHKHKRFDVNNSTSWSRNISWIPFRGCAVQTSSTSHPVYGHRGKVRATLHAGWTMDRVDCIMSPKNRMVMNFFFRSRDDSTIRRFIGTCIKRWNLWGQKKKRIQLANIEGIKLWTKKILYHTRAIFFS